MPKENQEPRSTRVVAEITGRKISYFYTLVHILIGGFMTLWLVSKFGLVSIPETLVSPIIFLPATSVAISSYVIYHSIRLTDAEELIKSFLSDKVPVLYLAPQLLVFYTIFVSNTTISAIYIFMFAYFSRVLAVYILRQGVSVDTTSLALSADEINEVEWDRFD